MGRQVALRSALMGSLYGAGGAFFTFRPVFMSAVVSPEQVGQILLFGSILTTVSNPIITSIADSHRAQRGLFLLSAAGQAFCQLCMLAPGMGYRGLLVLVSLHKFVGDHAFPIMDASTMAACGDGYGPIRLWGAIGFGVAALGGGSLISLSGSPESRSNFVTAFGFASAMQLLSLPMIWRLDMSALHCKSPPRRGGAGGGAEAEVGGSDGEGAELGAPRKPPPPPPPSGVTELLTVVSSAKMVFFTAVVFLSGFCGSLIDTYLNVHLVRLGASGLLMGSARLLTCVAEVPFFRVSGAILRALGVSGSLAAAQIAYLLRFLWYANLRPIARLGPWGLCAVLPVEMLHGLTFAVCWSAITAHCVRVAPAGMVSTTQQLISTVHWALAAGGGAAVGGRIMARAGGERVFQVGAMLAALNLGLAGVGSVLFGRELLGKGVGAPGEAQPST